MSMISKFSISRLLMKKLRSERMQAWWPSLSSSLGSVDDEDEVDDGGGDGGGDVGTRDLHGVLPASIGGAM